MRTLFLITIGYICGWLWNNITKQIIRYLEKDK